ncbi:MAG: hypothetical protein ABIH70_04410 [Chloroflexota bacterium]
MTQQITLTVNGNPINLDYFVQAFIEHTVSGMVEALEGTGPIKTLELSIDGNDVSLNLNGSPVSINAFVTRIIKSTTAGMVSTLKGVSDIKKVDINITK